MEAPSGPRSIYRCVKWGRKPAGKNSKDSLQDNRRNIKYYYCAVKAWE
jgi:hypothetical protein